MYREQIKEALLERILNGAYPPGERIVETRVAREFGVSQGPVREALRELETLRLVVSEPFVGVRVRAVSREELGEIYPVRSGLEEVAARTAPLRLDGDVRALEREVDAMRRAADAGAAHEFMPHDVHFHRLIVEASGKDADRAVDVAPRRGAHDDHVHPLRGPALHRRVAPADPRRHPRPRPQGHRRGAARALRLLRAVGDRAGAGRAPVRRLTPARSDLTLCRRGASYGRPL
jgi:hypothetical protein